MAKVTLINRAKIDFNDRYLDDLVSLANLPEGDIILCFHDNSLPENNQGVCVTSQLIKFAPEYLDIFPFLRLTKWDCLIAISEKWCNSRESYPAYFSYLLGHEFGHAHICLSDISLHIHCCLVHDWIKPASRSVIKFYHCLPNEQLFDQFGKYLSIQMHGAEKIDFEIDDLKKKVNDIELKHLELIKSLSPKSKIEGLRNLLIKFSLPYREELIKYWKKDFQQYGQNSLAHYIHDYDELFTL